VKFVVSEPAARLDVYLSGELGFTRAKIKGLIDGGHVLVEGKVPSKAGIRLRSGEAVEVTVPPPQPSSLIPADIALDILYEDEFLLAVNKPAGLVVHPAAGHWRGTLANALVHHFNKLSNVDAARPGIVHRLDKDTSGILLVAKADAAHLELSRQLKAHEIEKIYQTLVRGKMAHPKGTIDKPIGRHPKDRKKMGVIVSGRNAVTHYRVLEKFSDHTLLECKIETGRTHQIRVHLASIGHPVVGDTVYGGKSDETLASRQLLHAWKIKLKHPETGKMLSLEAPIPEDFESALRQLRR